MDLITVLTIVKQANTVKEMIEDKMIKILDCIGDTHLKAARKCFEDRVQSSNPDREIAAALANLQAAYQMFYDATCREKVLPIHDKRKYFRKAIVVSLLIAACYAYVREKKLLQQYIEQTRSMFEEYIECWKKHKTTIDWTPRLAFDTGVTKQIDDFLWGKFPETIDAEYALLEEQLAKLNY